MSSRPRRRRRAPGARTAALCLLLSMTVGACAGVPGARSVDVAAPDAAHPLLPAAAHFHFLRGYLAELDRDVPTALIEYQAALDVDPESVVLRVRLAALLVVAGAVPQATATLDGIPRAQVRDVALLTRMAKIYAGAGQSERALEFHDAAIRLAPEEGAPYFAKGMALLNLTRPRRAADAFTRGLARAPQSHLGHFYRGKALEAQGKLDEAMEEYRQAIARSERFAPAYQALAGLHESEGNISDALLWYERLVTSGRPQAKNFRNEFVRFLLRHQRYERALEMAEDMIADAPDDLNAHVRKALIYVEMRDFHRAIAALERLVDAHPSELRVRDYLGWAYEQVGDAQEAIEAYRTNITMDATFYDSHVHLGVLLYRLDRFDDAMPHLVRAVTLNPGNPDTHLLLGLSYLQAERFDLARSAFARGLEYHPADEDLRFNLGATYDKLNRFPDVVREMEAVLAINPDHADALNYLGYSYADRGIKGEEAVTLTRHAVSIKPDNGAYVDSLGWALFKVGRVADALRELKRAAELVDNDSVIFEHLGAIYLAQQRRERAQRAWVRSLELDPENESLIRRFREAGFGTPPHLSNRNGAPSDERTRVNHQADPVRSGASGQADAGP